MQGLQQCIAKKLEHRELVETEEIGLEAFLDYVVEQDAQKQIQRENYGSKIWDYIKKNM